MTLMEIDGLKKRGDSYHVVVIDVWRSMLINISNLQMRNYSLKLVTRYFNFLSLYISIYERVIIARVEIA